jgi:hypothetical protein
MFSFDLTGARLGKIYTDLYYQGGYSFNAGNCPTVGVGGHITGTKYILMDDCSCEEYIFSQFYFILNGFNDCDAVQ